MSAVVEADTGGQNFQRDGFVTTNWNKFLIGQERVLYGLTFSLACCH